MIVIFGLFFIVLGILLDEGTSLILFSKGFIIFESNPLYLKFGFIGFALMMCILYLFIISAWFYVNKAYYKIYLKKGVMYKMYDIFIFLFCFFIMFMTIGKFAQGFNNIHLIKDYMDDEKKVIIDEQIIQANIAKQNNELEYNSGMQKYYMVNVTKSSYLHIWLSAIFAFLLFRSGYKVSPYELD